MASKSPEYIANALLACREWEDRTGKFAPRRIEWALAAQDAGDEMVWGDGEDGLEEYFNGIICGMEEYEDLVHFVPTPNSCGNPGAGVMTNYWPDVNCPDCLATRPLKAVKSEQELAWEEEVGFAMDGRVAFDYDPGTDTYLPASDPEGEPGVGPEFEIDLEPMVEVEVGVVTAEVTPGPDGELGTSDDVVKLKATKPRPKRKSRAKAKAKPKRKPAKRKPAKRKPAKRKPAKKK